MFSTAVFSTQQNIGSEGLKTVTIIVGLVIGFLSILIKAIADKQKSQFKKIQPKSFWNIGFYRWVRCPNYLGEIIVWLGNFICTIAFFLFWWQWLIAIIGLICILLIMRGSAKRLEKKQLEKYRKAPDYLQYCKEVPIVFPWLPLYSLQKIKVYLE